VALNSSGASTLHTLRQAGLFGNQNGACKLRDAITIGKVSRHFGVPAPD
jgi:hypothetical protein